MAAGAPALVLGVRAALQPPPRSGGRPCDAADPRCFDARIQKAVRNTRVEAQWRPLGLLYVLQTQRGMVRFAAQDGMLRDTFGVAARRLEGSELPVFEPALRRVLPAGSSTKAMPLCVPMP